ncbi:unnamed protein product [Spirodela intermedia]|uniref:Uncharacterized protein n=1 Tax=Spirodela intermedia TaxID=51605 RepID=A0A7I8IF19_SPIIN|nr:unnamed protein product [Spirodela intermedia]CAA6655984.1 unnamed protein product [Spirodela intermedia]
MPTGTPRPSSPTPSTWSMSTAPCSMASPRSSPRPCRRRRPPSLRPCRPGGPPPPPPHHPLPQFIGLRNQVGLWSDSDYGSDVIVGVLDTGSGGAPIVLRSKPRPHTLSLEGGLRIWASFSPSDCNNKLIGARSFSKGHDAASVIGGGPVINETVEYRSPRDADGHGTHTASTAAGRHTFEASMAGYAAGIAKGVAPKARLAVYKVCWRGSGCLDSDILAGFDSAVADGVDVISVSIGGGDGVGSPYYLDPIAIGSYGAVSRGVFVSSSAGNDGPTSMSVTNLAPWLTTVGAGTIDRTFPADVVLGDGRKIAGVSLYSGDPLGDKMLPLVYPGKSGGLSASLCMENSLDPQLVKGAIVICERGSSPRRCRQGLRFLLAQPDGHHRFHGTMIGIKPAPLVASFSGRGPNGLSPAVLKPDLIAPGVNILAAWTDAVGPTGLDMDDRKTEFNILSGTSMACPHVSGAAALLKSAHPTWSPAAIRSAMMTTANVEDNRLLPVNDESTGKPSTPLDLGAGHLNLNRAMDPGLVYDLKKEDYVNFLCAIGYGPKTIQVITHEPVDCPEKKPAPENLNYPSFSVLFDGASSGNLSKTFIRTVTNIAAKGLTVRVKPRKLVFTSAVTALSYVFTVSADSQNLTLGESGSAFGFLSWSDGEHVVRSPIVVSRIQAL